MKREGKMQKRTQAYTKLALKNNSSSNSVTMLRCQMGCKNKPMIGYVITAEKCTVLKSTLTSS